MALFGNRVRETCTGSGTGDLTLTGAISGYKGFSDAIPVGDQVIYVVIDGDDFEIGIGTVTSANTLSRDTVRDTSQTTQIVNSQSAGTVAKLSLSNNPKIVSCDLDAQSIISQSSDGSIANATPFRNAVFLRDLTQLAAQTGMTANEGVYVLGGAVTGDGGGGAFYWDPTDGSAPDGVTSIRPTSVTTGLFKLAGGGGEVDASSLVGVIDPALIPDSVRAAPKVSTGDLTDLTQAQQDDIGEGSAVVVVDGRVFYYSGTGDKTLEASYVEGADVTPDASQIGGLGVLLDSKQDATQTALIDVINAVGGDKEVIRNALEIPESSADIAFATQAELSGSTLATDTPDVIFTTGYAVAGDGGHGRYKRADAEPAHAGKFQVIASDASTVWFELDEWQVVPELFGAPADGTGDDLPAILEAIAYCGQTRAQLALIKPLYRSSTRIPVTASVNFVSSHRDNTILIENGNTEEGFHVLASNVSFEGFTIEVNSLTPIINGSGDKGTCITTAAWFTDPVLAEPILIKNTSIKRMTLKRSEGSGQGHAIALLSRTSGVHIEDVDFIGGSGESFHGDAILTHWGAWSHGVSTHGISYSGQTSAFTEGATITGAASGAVGYIVQDENTGTSGQLHIKEVIGVFANGEALSDNQGGAATASSSPSTSLRQAPFEADRFSYHPNNIRIENIRCRNVGRVIACSASYGVHVDGVDYMGSVRGGQLVDLPVGDEGGDFAHPDDEGRVHSNFTFRNFNARNITGTGSNAVTAVDCSGFSSSKQRQSDLDAAGVGEFRQPRWRGIIFENFTFDYGEHIPASVTPVVRTLWLRNLHGDFTFRNFSFTNRPRADGEVIHGLTMALCRGSFVFDNCDLPGSVDVYGVEGLSITAGNIEVPEIEAGSYGVRVRGRSVSGTSNSRNMGSDKISLGVPFSESVIVGDRITWDGGSTIATKFHPANSMLIDVEPLPVALLVTTPVNLDHYTTNCSFNEVEVSGGSDGYQIEGCRGLTVSGGIVCATGQHGMIVGEDADVSVRDTIFEGNGLRRAFNSADANLPTRDVVLNAVGARLVAERLRFQASDFIVTNYEVGALSQCAILSQSVFAGSPITSQIDVDALGNGEPVRFYQNVDGDGQAVYLGGTWTPTLEIGGDGTGITYDVQNATYTVVEDRIHFDLDIRLTSKGSANGSVRIAGLPFSADGGSGTIPNIEARSGFDTLIGPPSGLVGGTNITLFQTGNAGWQNFTDARLTDTSRFNATGVYRINQ